MPANLPLSQLYVNVDRIKSEAVLRRIVKAGYKAIVLTVDAAVAGKRTRDERTKVIDLPVEDMGVSGAGKLPEKGQTVVQATGKYARSL